MHACDRGTGSDARTDHVAATRSRNARRVLRPNVRTQRQYSLRLSAGAQGGPSSLRLGWADSTIAVGVVSAPRRGLTWIASAQPAAPYPPQRSVGIVGGAFASRAPPMARPAQSHAQRAGGLGALIKCSHARRGPYPRGDGPTQLDLAASTVAASRCGVWSDTWPSLNADFAQTRVDLPGVWMQRPRVCEPRQRSASRHQRGGANSQYPRS